MKLNIHFQAIRICDPVLDAFPVSSRPALAAASRQLQSAVAWSSWNSGQFKLYYLRQEVMYLTMFS